MFTWTYLRLVGCLTLGVAAQAHAGTVSGQLELPSIPGARPPRHGFLDPQENDITPVRGSAAAHGFVVVLENGPVAPASKQVVWEIIGERFAKTPLPVWQEADLIIKNTSKNVRYLTASDAKLIDKTPLNPTTSKTVKMPPAGQTVVISDTDSAHLRGVVIVTPTPYATTVDRDGRFELSNVPAGKWQLRIYYYDGQVGRYLDQQESLTVSVSGKIDVKSRIAPQALTPPR